MDKILLSVRLILWSWSIWSMMMHILSNSKLFRKCSNFRNIALEFILICWYICWVVVFFTFTIKTYKTTIFWPKSAISSRRSANPWVWPQNVRFNQSERRMSVNWPITSRQTYMSLMSELGQQQHKRVSLSQSWNQEF